MTPERFVECIDIIRRPGPPSYRELGAWIGIDQRLLRRMAQGEAPIHDDIALWLETVAAFYRRPDVAAFVAMIEAFHENNPPPAKVMRKD